MNEKNKMSNETCVLQFDLVCSDAWYVDMFQATLSVGFLVGSIAIGYMADKYGRDVVVFYFFFSFSSRHGSIWGF